MQKLKQIKIQLKRIYRWIFYQRTRQAGVYRFDPLRLVFVLAVLLLLIGITMSIQTSEENHRAFVFAKEQVELANEGKPSLAPSTIRPTLQAITDYNVPPLQARYLSIPALHVFARVGAVGVTASGAIGTPNNVYDTDWYNRSALPGQPGATLIDGHISSWTTKGVFYGLSTLKPGDSLVITTGNGNIYTYTVQKKLTYQANNVDMQAVLSPVNSAVPGLNLISCSGDVIAGTNSFNQRIVVFASLTHS